MPASRSLSALYKIKKRNLMFSATLFFYFRPLYLFIAEDARERERALARFMAARTTENSCPDTAMALAAAVCRVHFATMTRTNR